MRRAFVLILILIAIISMAGAYFVSKNQISLTDSDPRTTSDRINETTQISPSTIPTPNLIPDDWLSYTSEQYHFMIRYPRDIEQETTSEGERFYKLGPTQTSGTELFDGISVIVSAGNTDTNDFNAFVSKRYQDIKNSPTQPEISELETVVIAGKSGYAFTVQSMGKRTEIYLPHEDDQYIHISNATVEPSNRPQTYQTIVSTMLTSLIYE